MQLPPKKAECFKNYREQLKIAGNCSSPSLLPISLALSKSVMQAIITKLPLELNLVIQFDFPFLNRVVQEES